MTPLRASITGRPAPAGVSPRDVVAGPRNDLSDVAGVRVGHHQRIGPGWRTGTTVVLPPTGSTTAVDVRGGGPGTRETDALDPRNVAQEAHGICLTGGSAYGLAAADGVMSWLEERGIGFPVGIEPGLVVPIVPSAVVFDLGRGGSFRSRPDPSFGRRAAQAAGRTRRDTGVALGSVGAGTGAIAGRIAGGTGSASAVVPTGVTVAALVAVNASGRVFDPQTGLPYGAPHLAPADPQLRRPPRHDVRAAIELMTPIEDELNTTIGVVATDAVLTRPQAQKVAGLAHDGLARAVQPAHLMSDGDTFFAIATGRRPIGPTPPPDAGGVAEQRAAMVAFNELLAAAADVVTRAVVRAILAADGWDAAPSYRDLFPTAVVVRPRR